MSSLSVDETGWVGIPVLLDLVWEMTHNHKMKRVEVFQILDKLLSSREIVVEQSEIVRESLNLYRNTRADFADCLIAASAKAAGCSRTVTFDRIAARDAGMELVG
jgi:predicted nucleic-acid-binding protein